MLRIIGGGSHTDWFTFTCLIPGRYRLRRIDRSTLHIFLDEGREGIHQEIGGEIIWMERDQAPARLTGRDAVPPEVVPGS